MDFIRDVFGEIYCLFQPLYSIDLAEHMWGWDGTAGVYVKTNLFNVVGIIMVVITILISMGYYLILNHPRFNRWWSWLIVLGIVGFSNMMVGFYFPYRDFVNGNISEDIVDNISVVDCWLFGVTNFIVSVLFFFIISFFMKGLSSNCKLTPFPYSLKDLKR